MMRRVVNTSVDSSSIKEPVIKVELDGFKLSDTKENKEEGGGRKTRSNIRVFLFALYFSFRVKEDSSLYVTLQFP